VSERAFGIPSKKLVDEAMAEFKGIKTSAPEQNTIDVLQTKLAFEEALRRYGLTHWRVLIDEQLTADCAVGKIRTLYLRKGALFSRERVESLIRHEVETHVLTTENGKLQPYKIFAQGCARYQMTQEGLAVYNQAAGNQQSEEYYMPAAATVAVALAAKYPFAETYGALRDAGISEEKAFRFTVKAKRGMASTAEPGACTKNYIYFAGRKMIQQFVLSGGSIKDLYIGKIALPDLELVKHVEGLREPKYLPKNLSHLNL
jgi:hypothetical protein